jgi:ppGpp synthetase/RelA/SpoT-type nucleotidyltranferase
VTLTVLGDVDLEDGDEAALYKEYQLVVASIREFEPELQRTLILPLSEVPRVLSAKWRIKSWEAVLYKQKRKRKIARNYFFANDMFDILGVRVVYDGSPFDAVEAVIGASYEIVEATLYDQANLPHSQYHQAHYVLRPGASTKGPLGLPHFELQVVTAAAQAFAEMQHVLLYQGSFATRVRVGTAFDVDGEFKSAAEALKGAEKIDVAIERLSSLLDCADVHEKRDVHPFLVEHAYFLHPALETIVSEPAIGVGTEFKPDFIIREATGEYVLVEIESPKCRLFTKRGDFTAEVSHAVQQVEDWQEWLEQNLPTAQRHYPDIVSPRGSIVIGRSSTLSEKERQKLARRNINTRGRLEILTYDDLILRTRAYIAGIRKHLGM